MSYHLQLIPFNLDGPGIDLIISDQQTVAAGAYQVMAPKLGSGNYVFEFVEVHFDRWP